MNILSSSLFEMQAQARKSGLLTVLDIGSGKISCVIARLQPLQKTLHLPWRTHRVEVLAFAARQSKGVRAGMIVDIAAAERVIRNVVDAAERKAGLLVKSVIVSFSGRHMQSEHSSAEIALEQERVQDIDIKQVIAAACVSSHGRSRPVIHAVPLSFYLDKDQYIEDPRSMEGRRLGVNMHCLAVDAAAARNLEHCLNRAYLKAEALVAAPYASALSTLLREDIIFGGACIDWGAGTTSFAVFHKGKFVHAECLSIGGNHITADIAQGFSIPLEEAERLKIMHGSAVDYAGGEHYVTLAAEPVEDKADYGETAGKQRFPREKLTKIIRARTEEISEMVRDRCARAGFRFVGGRRLILTGGASQLVGLPEIVHSVMQIRPRIGRPLGISGLPSAARSGAYAALAGLAIYPQSRLCPEREFNSFGTEYERGRKIKQAGTRLLQSVNGYVKVFKAL